MFSCCVSAATYQHAGVLLGFRTFLTSQDYTALLETSELATGLEIPSRVGMWKSEPVYCALGFFLGRWDSLLKPLYEQAIGHGTPKTEHSISGFRSHSSSHFDPAHLWSRQAVMPILSQFFSPFVQTFKIPKIKVDYKIVSAQDPVNLF